MNKFVAPHYRHCRVTRPPNAPNSAVLKNGVGPKQQVNCLDITPILTQTPQPENTVVRPRQGAKYGVNGVSAWTPHTCR